jgi:hypothetical protein
MSNKRDVSKIKHRIASGYDSIRSVNSFVGRNNVEGLPKDFKNLVSQTLKNLTECLEMLAMLDREIKEKERKEQRAKKGEG